MNFQGDKFGIGLSALKDWPVPFCGFLLATLFVVTPVAAAPLQIQILDQQFAAYTHSQLHGAPLNPEAPGPVVVSNLVTAPFALNEFIWSPTWVSEESRYNGPLQQEAQSEARLFRVGTSAQSVGWVRDGFNRTSAAALTRVAFTSATAGVGTFDFDLTGFGQSIFFGRQLIRLTDLTLGQEVWSYGGVFSFAGDVRVLPASQLLPTDTTFQQAIPWAFLETGFGAHLTLDTLLNTTSTYELLIYSDNNCVPAEVSGTTITWADPTLVPEPTVLALVFCGALGLVRRGRNLSVRLQ